MSFDKMPDLSFLVLEEQPDFPETDLTEHNADLLGTFILPHQAGVETHATFLEHTQQGLYVVALGALQLDGETRDLNKADYRSFCRGFASFEYISLLMRTPAAYDVERASNNVFTLYIEPGHFVNFEIGQRTAPLEASKPNVFRAITDAGEIQNETRSQLKARILGAQVACELQSPQAA